MRNLIPVFLLTLLTLLPAKPLHAWTPAEIRAMPTYCAGRYARHDNPAEYRRWEAIYGPDFLHTHHLCDGIGYLDRYYKAKNQAAKNLALKDAMSNLNYMIQHAKPDFKLMPEVYLYRSQVLNLTKKSGEAVADLRKAISLDPKQAKFYTQAANILEQINQRNEALILVTEGLRHLPDNKSLQRVYTKLGGGKPFPEPYEKKMASAGKDSASSTPKPQEEAIEPKLAVFDFSRLLGGGGNVLREAGAYFFVELREDPKNKNEKVLFKIISRMPQPATRIPRIGIDVGRHTDLFSTVQVVDDFLFSKHYPLQRNNGAFVHPFWRGFTPTYLASFTTKVNKIYHPDALPPGGTLTLSATLNPGKRIEDVFEAMKQGLQSNDGLRFAIFLYHTKGYRPDPSKTIMDDGGYATGSLRNFTGFAEQPPPVTKPEVSPMESRAAQNEGNIQADTETRQQRVNESTSTNDKGIHSAGQSETLKQPAIGIPSNPWCRFCPTEPSK